jgi:hypothetical protein
MDGQPAKRRDAAALVLDAEAHDPCALAVDLDHEAAELLRLTLRPFDLREQLLARRRPPRGEIWVHLVVRRQLDEEVDVVGCRPPDRDAHRFQTVPGTGATMRRGFRSASANTP